MHIPIPMLIDLLLLVPIKPQFQISASAKDLPSASEDNAFYAVVCVEEGVCMLELEHHGIRKRIVVFRAIQRKNDNRRVFLIVLSFNLREGQVVVGFREGERRTRDAGHDDDERYDLGRGGRR